jgi:hypothetical protein
MMFWMAYGPASGGLVHELSRYILVAGSWEQQNQKQR